MVLSIAFGQWILVRAPSYQQDLRAQALGTMAWICMFKAQPVYLFEGATGHSLEVSFGD